MEPDLAASVFKPYVSAKGDNGTGFGLAIVASVAPANGGAVRLETTPGLGTRFAVLWPTTDQTHSAAPAAVPSPASPAGWTVA